jgi:hypothetical protein
MPRMLLRCSFIRTIQKKALKQNERFEDNYEYLYIFFHFSDNTGNRACHKKTEVNSIDTVYSFVKVLHVHRFSLKSLLSLQVN